MAGAKADAERARTRPITKKMRLAIAALARGETMKDAARCAGVRSRGTVYEWMKRPEFVAALEQHKADRLDAVQAIRAMTKSEKIPPMVRYKAACTLAEMTSGSTKTRTGMEDRDAILAGSILP